MTLNPLTLIQNIRPQKELPSCALQLRHLASIFSMSFNDDNLLIFKESLSIKFDGGNYRVLKSKMPMLKKPANMLEFIMDCNRYGIALTLKFEDSKDYSLYSFLYEND